MEDDRHVPSAEKKNQITKERNTQNQLDVQITSKTIQHTQDLATSTEKKEITEVKHKGNVSFLEARKIVGSTGFIHLYFKMVVIPLVPKKNMVDVSKLISLKPVGQESHVICAHNYICTFDFVPRIWS